MDIRYNGHYLNCHLRMAGAKESSIDDRAIKERGNIFSDYRTGPQAHKT